MSYKAELYNDHFQNWKKYLNRKAQLIICDVPYNLGNILHAFNMGLSKISESQRRNAMRPVELTYPSGLVRVVDSVKEAAMIVGYAHYNSIYKSIRKGFTTNGFKLRYITKGQYDNTLL